MHPNFEQMYPLSVAYGLRPVASGAVEHAGFDQDEVEHMLGDKLFHKFYSWLVRAEKSVFSCGHRHWPEDRWPADHDEAYKNGAEVHCIYAQDLEEFLRREKANG